MRFVYLAMLASIFTFLAACSNHPLTDDVTPYSTYDIIHKVHCEAQRATLAYYDSKGFAAKEKELAKLDDDIKSLQERLNGEDMSRAREADKDARTKLNDDIERHTRRLNQTKRRIDSLVRQVNDLIKAGAQDKAAKLLEQIEETRVIFDRQKYDNEVLKDEKKTLDGRLKIYEDIEKEIAKKKKMRTKDYGSLLNFNDTSMASSFRFEITENNNNTVNGSFTWPIHLGTLSVGYDVGDKRKRNSRRSVKAATTFKELNKVGCRDADHTSSPRAKRYPITGNIGMAELVSQYLEVTSHGVKLQNQASSKETFTDTLQFTTTINGGVKPSIALTTASKVAIKGEANLAVDRTDLHEVAVEIAPPAEASSKEGAAAKLSIESLPEVELRIVRDPDEISSWRPLVR